MGHEQKTSHMLARKPRLLDLYRYVISQLHQIYTMKSQQIYDCGWVTCGELSDRIYDVLYLGNFTERVLIICLRIKGKKESLTTHTETIMRTTVTNND